MATSWADVSVAEEFHEFDAALWWSHGYRYLPEELALEPGSRVLDVGCGSGELARWFAAQHGSRVIAADPSEAMLARAQPAPRVSYRRLLDGRLDGIDDRSVDAAASTFVYECEPDEDRLRRLTREIARVLRPGGRFALLGGNPGTLGVLFDGLRQGEPGVDYRPGDRFPVDMRRRDGSWSRVQDVYRPARAYEQLLTGAGLALVRRRTPASAETGGRGSVPAPHRRAAGRASSRRRERTSGIVRPVRLWHAVVVIATGAAVALVATAALPLTAARLVADLTGLLGALAAAVAFAVTGSRRGERWRGWLAAALTLWAAAQGLWTWHRYAGGLAETFPDVENALYLGLPIFTFLAIVRGTRRSPSPGRPEDVVSSRRVLVLDGLIIIASFVALSWEVTFGALLNGRFSGTLLLAVSYTLGDLMLIVLVILSAVALQNMRRVPMVWLVFGLVAIGTSDTLFAYAISRGVNSPPWSEIGYMVGPVLLLFAATVPDRALSQFRPRLPMLFLPYVPLSAVLLIRLISDMVLNTPDPTSMIAGYLVGLVVGLVVLRQLVTLRQLYAAHQQLHHQATHDHLTGAANRALLLEHLAAALARARRQHHHVGLLYVDLNHFKQVNDVYGHSAGDTVLYACAKRLQACARESDLVARVGGDEFVLVLEPAPKDPTAIKERLRSELRQPVSLGDRSLEEIGASVGYVPVGAGESPVLALAHADEAMYREKQVPPGSS